ncbi:MAG: hypothetical protein JWO67_5369 [Streptosporangiaceae bacterium]|jgi:hypothetical protein|nr:hypothetical protein [Streptosporangiaceae bacterium]
MGFSAQGTPGQIPNSSTRVDTRCAAKPSAQQPDLIFERDTFHRAGVAGTLDTAVAHIFDETRSVSEPPQDRWCTSWRPYTGVGIPSYRAFSCNAR